MTTLLLSDLIEEGTRSGLAQIRYALTTSKDHQIDGACAIGYAALGYCAYEFPHIPVLTLRPSQVEYSWNQLSRRLSRQQHYAYTKRCSHCEHLIGGLLAYVVHINDRHKVPIREIIDIVRQEEAVHGLREVLDVTVPVTVQVYDLVTED